jgi:hypothetical protein
MTNIEKQLLCRVSGTAETMIRTLRRDYPRKSVLFCATDEAFRATVRRLAPDDIAGIVWEASAAVPRWPNHIPTEVVQLSINVPLVVHAQPTGSVIREVVSLASRAADLRVSLLGFNDLEYECRTLLSGSPQTSATQPILATIGPVVAGPRRHILTTAAIAAKRRISVRQFAEYLACSPGTLRRWVGSTGPETHRLIGFLTCVHVAWRRAVLDWTVKRTAAETGADAAALDHYVRRHCHCRLARLTEPRQFSDLLHAVRRLIGGSE